MTAVRSSPVTVRVACPGSLLAESSCRVTMPSTSTVGNPLSTTVRITRVFGSKKPVGSSTRLITDSLLMAKVSWKPLGPLADVVTCAAVRASVSGAGTGTGRVGPIISVSENRPSATGCSRQALRQGDPQPATHLRGQVVGPQRTVRVGDPPELLRVAQVGGRDGVQPAARHDDVLVDDHELLRSRHEPPAEKADGPPGFELELGGLDGRVAAGRRQNVRPPGSRGR